LVIPPKIENALEEAMIRIMNDKELYDQIGSNARESIVPCYDQMTTWKLIKEEYDVQLKCVDLKF